MSSKRSALILAVALVLSGCASSHILTGTPRAPLDPSQVEIYYGPPPGRYEEIARLDVGSGAFTYGEQNKTNATLNRLRREAAKLGANGVLFQGTADAHGGSGVSVGGGLGRGGGRTFSSVGVGVDISPRQKYAQGVAIWLHDPPTARPNPPHE